MTAKPKTSILFVCLGNICRSPLAEGVLRATFTKYRQADAFFVDSAGTGGWHAGSAPDPRSIRVASRHGVDIAGQICRQVTEEDFRRFDLIFGMDRANVAELRRLAPQDRHDHIHLFHQFATGASRDVPDPYYGGPEGFDEVYRMICEASEALAAKLGCRVSDLRSGHASSTM